MDEEQHNRAKSARQIVEEAVWAWQGGDDAAFWRLLHPDVTYEAHLDTALVNELFAQ